MIDEHKIIDLAGLETFKKNILSGGKTVEKSSSYTLDNAVDYPIVDMRIYGKSTQDGVPTPDAPVDIVSVGDSGAVGVTACGKNLLDVSNCTNATNIVSSVSNGVISFIKPTAIDWSSSYIGKFYYKRGTKVTLSVDNLPYGRFGLSKSNVNRPNNDTSIFTVDGDNTDTILFHTTLLPKCVELDYDGMVYIWFCSDSNFSNAVEFSASLQVELGDTATAYEPYIGSTATLTSALPLCGIPVSEGGNYTDSNGQQWIADEVIYNADGSGKIVKRTMSMLLDGSDDEDYAKGNTTETYETFGVVKSLDKNLPIKYTENMICNNTAIMSGFKTTVNDFALHCGNNLNITFGINMGITTIEAVKTWLTEHPTVIIYPLRTPQEIPLTAEEMAQLEALQTFDGVTNISNDGGAEMSVKYCTNKALSEYEKPVIDGLKKQIDELKTAVLSLGGNV